MFEYDYQKDGTTIITYKKKGNTYFVRCDRGYEGIAIIQLLKNIGLLLDK